MAKIRHIAFRADDVEAMAQFFVEGFGMSIAQRREMGAIDLTDGTVGITILPAGRVTSAGERPGTGVDHIGFTFENEDEARRLIEAAGGKERNTVPLGQVHYEIKYEGPEQIIVDVGHWVGTAPVGEEAAAGAKS